MQKRCEICKIVLIACKIHILNFFQKKYIEKSVKIVYHGDMIEVILQFKKKNNT